MSVPAEDFQRQRPIPRQARTARRLLVAIPVTFVLAVIAVRIVVNLDIVRRAVAIRVAEAVANRTRGSVQLSGVTFDWKLAPCFQNLEIYTVEGPYRFDIATRQACVERWFSALGSGFRSVRVRLDSPALQFRGAPDQGPDAPFVNVRPTITATRTTGRPVLRELTVVFDDLRLAWDNLPVPDRLAAGAVGPIDGHIILQRRGSLSAATIAIRDRATGARVDGRATPSESGWDLSAAVEGDLVPIFGSLSAAAPFEIRKMPCRGRLGARYGQRRLTVDLDLEEYDVDFVAELVSKGRVVGLDGRQQLRMVADFAEGTVALGPGLVEVNGVPLDLTLRIDNKESAPAFSGEVSLRTIPLAQLLRSFPGSPAPEPLRNLDPTIRLALSFEIEGLLSDASTWQPKLEHRLVGVTRRTRTGLEFLTQPFKYRPLTKDGRTREPLLRGPKTPGWLTYQRIPYVQRRAIMISEDSTFPFHRGVELAEVKDAIQAAMIRGRRVRGGSTLTQQLVKNLFLNRDRTALRKAAELVLTFYVESVLKKPQIFELYANIIEWGPDIYGLDAAAQHYFGKSPRWLTPLEMAYLASIIPAPLRFYSHFENGRVPPGHRKKVDLLIERLHRLGQLDDVAYTRAIEGPIIFSRRRVRRENQP